MRLLKSICLILILLLLSTTPAAQAGELTERLAKFPHWQSKPGVELPNGELIYPSWMEGTWSVTSTLIEQVAPLAPAIVTPGFVENSKYLNQAVEFKVRFYKNYFFNTKTSVIPAAVPKKLPIVPDRAFNGLNIAQAYLGGDQIITVKVDPNNPNQQITYLSPQGKVISQVTGRKTEEIDDNRFIATEMIKQIFRRQGKIYFNEVETTTAYLLTESGKIQGEQITAIYLSPQDPNYFKAVNHPVALYRYNLELLATY